MGSASISIRIPEELKDDLDTFSFRNSVSPSYVVRDAIEEYISPRNSQNRKPKRCYYFDDGKSKDLILSFGFSRLVFWIYEKRIYPKIIENDKNYRAYIRLIGKLKSDPLFNQKVKRELVKIETELSNYLNGNHSNNSIFEFALEENYDGFNYHLFSEYYDSLSNDVDDNRILNMVHL